MNSFPPSGSISYAFRLKPGQDLKKEILAFARQKNIQAGCIVTCVGSARQIHLRLANQLSGMLKKGYFEILSLSGTFSREAVHLHLSVADQKGKCLGGHLLEKTILYTTAEMVVTELKDLTFERVPDKTTGYAELTIRKRTRARKKS